MRLRSTRSAPRTNFDIVVTSMLDINFLLIMFFMMTVHFQQMSAVELDLPVERGAENRVEEDHIIVNLEANGDIVVGSRAVSLDGLRNVVASEVARTEGGASAVRVLVRADRAASAARLNDVVSLMQKAGVGLGRFGTEVPK